MVRRVSIFGATGSIGQNTIDLIKRDQKSFKVIALSGGLHVDRLAKDAIDLRAEIAVTAYEDQLGALKNALSGSNVQAAAGTTAIQEAAERPTDWTMSAIVGAAGLVPSLATLRHGNTLALANKESLVAAGPLLMGAAQTHCATVLPVDSEHSALFQALIGEDRSAVERVIITASGGAFRDWPLEDLAKATPEQATKHPNWAMGQRITVDSASMFNKALELIEAKEYFGFSPDQIEVLIHPESMVHAMVGFNDGGIMAHVGPPDMRHAIGFALHWPKRGHLPVERLDLANIGQLNFRAPDEQRWPALRLAYDVMRAGGLHGTVFNAAKERALDGFLARRIGFTDMARLVEQVLTKMSAESGLSSAEITLDNITELDHLARIRVDEFIQSA